jgi:hypothetical protein
VDESTDIEIRFNVQAADSVLPDELALIESILPDLIRELMQDDLTYDD